MGNLRLLVMRLAARLGPWSSVSRRDNWRSCKGWMTASCVTPQMPTSKRRIPASTIG